MLSFTFILSPLRYVEILVWVCTRCGDTGLVKAMFVCAGVSVMLHLTPFSFWARCTYIPVLHG